MMLIYQTITLMPIRVDESTPPSCTGGTRERPSPRNTTRQGTDDSVNHADTAGPLARPLDRCRQPVALAVPKPAVEGGVFT